MGLSLSIKMNRERFPTSGADDSAKITLRLTRAELLERAIGREEVAGRSAIRPTNCLQAVTH